jgi:hypothetical protein
MKPDVILTIRWVTGFGDFYTCLVYVKTGYDILTEYGYNVQVRLVSDDGAVGQAYACADPHKFIQENFNLDEPFANNFSIHTKYPLLPDGFDFLREVKGSYNIFNNKKLNKDKVNLLRELELEFELNLENFATWADFQKLPLKYCNPADALISSALKTEIEDIVNQFGKFDTFHFRVGIPPHGSSISQLSPNYESHFDTNDYLNICKEAVLDNVDSTKSVFIGSNISKIDELLVDGLNMVDLPPIDATASYGDVDGIRMKHDLIAMCIHAYADTIYSVRHWTTNFFTFSYLHNIHGFPNGASKKIDFAKYAKMYFDSTQ